MKKINSILRGLAYLTCYVMTGLCIVGAFIYKNPYLAIYGVLPLILLWALIAQRKKDNDWTKILNK